MSIAIAFAPSHRRSRWRSRKAIRPLWTRKPSHTPSPSTKPESNTETFASSRGFSSPLTLIRIEALRASAALSWVPFAIRKRMLGRPGLGKGKASRRPHRCGRRPCLPHSRTCSGDLGGLDLFGIAKDVAAAPDGLDIIVAAAGQAQLLAQLADEDVDDLELGLVHAAVKMVEEHLLGERRALAEREQLQHLVFLAGEVHAGAADFDRLLVEVDGEVAGVDDRLGMALGAPHDRVDARHQLVLVERLGHVVV